MTKGKSPTDSAIETAHLMMPQDANPSGNVFGGRILSYVDETAALVARRHCRTNMVTASVDRVDFYHPVFVGDLLVLKASVNFVGHTSLEVGVCIEAEDKDTGKRRKTGSCYVTLVSLNTKGNPKKIPRLAITTKEEKRRWKEAEVRKKDRIRLLKEIEKTHKKYI